MPSTPNLLSGALVLALSLPVQSLASIDELLGSGRLEGEFNAVVLDYLLDEGRDNLTAEQHRQAVDQLVAALKQDLDITPAEQRAAASAVAASSLAQLFGGETGAELGDAAGDATYLMWKGWVDSAFTLERAGYEEDARRFFDRCLEVYPYNDLRGRCAVGLATADPEQAVQRLMALTEGNDPGAINAALRILGELAAAEGMSAEHRKAIVDRLESFTGGMKKASYGLDACRGLVASRDPAALPTLQALSKGMMNKDFYTCARRGLLLTFDDGSVVPLLEKQLKGGTFSAVEPWERLAAAGVLMEAGVESGYVWAEEQFGKKSGGKGMKLLKGGGDDYDYQSPLVGMLVRIGGDRSRKALARAITQVEPGSWTETWIAIGLLELDDTTHLDLARQALAHEEWEFTSVRIATALARHGDESGIPALAKLYAKAVRGESPGKVKGLAKLFDDGDDSSRLLNLRHQIADALGRIDRPSAVDLLVSILDDPEPAVRASAAYALARMTVPAADDGLGKAIAVDYGAEKERSRNPTVHAHVARWAARSFPDEDATPILLGTAAKDPSPAVQLLALSLSSGR